MRHTGRMDADTAERFRSLHRLVGNTPLLAVDFTWRGEPRVIYAKQESMNLTGSIKDRMALYILEHGYRDGRIRPGDPIAEATSGNTGISFAAIGRALGHPVTVFMPDWMSAERMSLIASFGASIVPVSRGARADSSAASASPKRSPPATRACSCRVSSRTTPTCGRTSTPPAPRSGCSSQQAGLEPDAFVAGVGTGGTVMGVGRYLRTRKPAVRVHPLEPAESPTLSTGHKVGQHRIQGISDEFIPPIVKLDELDRGGGRSRRRRDPHGAAAGAPRAGGRHLVGRQLSRRAAGAERPRAPRRSW